MEEEVEEDGVRTTTSDVEFRMRDLHPTQSGAVANDVKKKRGERGGVQATIRVCCIGHITHMANK